MGPLDVKPPWPGSGAGVEKSAEVGNLKAHSAALGTSGIALRRSDSIRMQAIGQIGVA
jgi:hypothetical protein